jgi:hypothetical protein
MVETSIWSCRANRTQGMFRAVGGPLVPEGDQLEFRPRGLNPLNGALRERLRIELDDGSVELFVVSPTWTRSWIASRLR